MMTQPDPATPSTLGQRIDALLGPLEIEARQYREVIDLGRDQVRKMQDKIGQAEQALAEIESKMSQVLETLTREEPMLASAVGRQARAAGATAKVSSTAQPDTPAAIQPPIATPTPTPTSTPAPVPELAVPEIEATPIETAAAAPPGDTSADLPAPTVTAQEDAEAVEEILGLLDAVPTAGEADSDQTPSTGSLAAAADRAEQTAQRLDDALAEPGSTPNL